MTRGKESFRVGRFTLKADDQGEGVLQGWKVYPEGG
jgi:hypothetical protein